MPAGIEAITPSLKKSVALIGIFPLSKTESTNGGSEYCSGFDLFISITASLLFKLFCVTIVGEAAASSCGFFNKKLMFLAAPLTLSRVMTSPFFGEPKIFKSKPSATMRLLDVKRF